MAFFGNYLLKSASVALVTALALPAGGVLAPTAAVAASTLPAPYVSRSLDAVLMPVDASVASAFGLAAGTTGVLVLATQPGGLADTSGILPGDVIDFVGKKPIAAPIDLDEYVYYMILQGLFDFDFRGLRDGTDVVTTMTITLEYWEEVIEITEVSSWVSYSYESFSYEEYYTEYSEEISVSYEESVSIIEETVTSEEYSEEVSEYSEETTEEMTTEEDVTDEATDEAADEAADETADETIDESEDEAADEAVDEGADEGGDEAVDEGADDEGGDEEASDDAGDEGGDDGGDEEPVEE